MSITLTALQKQRTDTAANWTSANPTLLSGELGFESDTGKMKLGNGSTAWNSLAYLILIPSSGLYPGTQLLMPLGSASVPSLSFSGDTNTGIYSTGADKVAISTGGTGRVFIDSQGNVSVGNLFISYSKTSIGIASPDGAAIRLHDSDLGVSTTNGLELFVTNGGDGHLWQRENNPIKFGTNNTERLRITSGGLVGIGNSSPGYPLDITQGASGYGQQISSGTKYLRLGANDPEVASVGADLFLGAAASQKLYLRTGGTTALTVDASARVGIGTQSPQALFHSKAGATTSAGIFESGSASGSWLSFVDTGTSSYTRVQVGSVGNELVLRTTDLERARIDSSGRLLVGTSTASKNADRLTGSKIALVGVGDYPSHVITGYSNANADAGPIIDLQKSRGSSDGSMTVVASGDRIGSINFLGADGTNFIRAAAINSEVDGTPGTNDMPGRLVFSVTQDGSASPSGRAQIDNTGRFYTYPATGTDGCVFMHPDGAGTTNTILGGWRSATSVGGASAVNVFKVFTNGNVQNTNNSYGSLSDIKLKENIVDAGSQWNDLKALQVRKYNLKEGQTHTQIGLIAQEVELVSPGLVYETPDRDEDNNDLGTVTKSVNYSVLYMKAVKALQEAMDRIEQLEAEMAEVKAQLS